MRSSQLALLFLLSASALHIRASELPPARCELNVAYAAHSDAGEWPLGVASVRIVNFLRTNLSSWQVVWTLVDDEQLLGESVRGALLINPGGRACMGCLESRALPESDAPSQLADSPAAPSTHWKTRR
jgi:hypothetical protein